MKRIYAYYVNVLNKIEKIEIDTVEQFDDLKRDNPEKWFWSRVEAVYQIQKGVSK